MAPCHCEFLATGINVHRRKIVFLVVTSSVWHLARHSFHKKNYMHRVHLRLWVGNTWTFASSLVQLISTITCYQCFTWPVINGVIMTSKYLLQTQISFFTADPVDLGIRGGDGSTPKTTCRHIPNDKWYVRPWPTGIFHFYCFDLICFDSFVHPHRIGCNWFFCAPGLRTCIPDATY